MKKDGEDDDKGMVRDVDGVRSLGGREMLSSMRDGICIFVAVVVAALMVAVGVVVLMVAVGVVALVIVVKVSCIGVVGVVGVLCIGVVEEDCAGVVDILVLGEVFVVEVVEGVQPVRCVVRLLLWCANGRGYFLCRFSLKLVEMSGLTLGGFLFGIAIWADCFALLECGDTSCGWCGGVGCCGCVGVVGVVCGLRLGVGVDSVGNGEECVVTSGDISSTDGGGATWRDCGRFLYGICGELWEDFLYRLPFTFDIGDVFL